jgi:1,4-alpha-glucan branching enzyme
MGQEFAQVREWNHDTSLDWHLLDDPRHAGIQTLVRDLNALMRDCSPLHAHDFTQQGFEWIDCHDHAQSIVSFLRRDGDAFVVVVVNATPVPRHDYRIGVPVAGRYVERLNTDAGVYGGSNVGNLGAVTAEAKAWMGRDHSVTLSLPPLGAIVLAPTNT